MSWGSLLQSGLLAMKGATLCFLQQHLVMNRSESGRSGERQHTMCSCLR